MQSVREGDETAATGSEIRSEHWPWPSALHRDLAEEFLKINRRRNAVHPDSVLDNSAFAILWILSDGRPRTLRELTRELDLEQSTVNRQVNGAIRSGYLERFEVDGCASRKIRPTDHGRAAFEHDGLLRANRLSEVFADLAPGRADVLLTEMRAYNQAYDRVLERARPTADRTRDTA